MTREESAWPLSPSPHFLYVGASFHVSSVVPFFFCLSSSQIFGTGCMARQILVLLKGFLVFGLLYGLPTDRYCMIIGLFK